MAKEAEEFVQKLKEKQEHDINQIILNATISSATPLPSPNSTLLKDNNNDILQQSQPPASPTKIIVDVSPTTPTIKTNLVSDSTSTPVKSSNNNNTNNTNTTNTNSKSNTSTNNNNNNNVTTTYKKGTELNAPKKMTNSDECESKTIVRDPRLANQRIKTIPKSDQQKQQQQQMDTSPPLNKKKLLSTQQNESKNSNNNGLKRSSPSNSSIQNLEVKKVKLTPPTVINGDNSNKISPVKSTTSSSSSSNSSSSTNINQNPNKSQLTKVSPTLNSNNKSQITNKVSKIIFLPEGEIDESKFNKQLPNTSGGASSDKSSKSTKNSISSKQDNKASLPTTITSSTTSTKQINKQDKSTSENVKTVKSIPSLFDIQTTPNLVTTTVTSSASIKSKQPVSKQSINNNQTKSKQNIQQTITNKQPTTKHVNTNKKSDSNDKKSSTSKSPELNAAKQDSR